MFVDGGAFCESTLIIKKLLLFTCVVVVGGRECSGYSVVLRTTNNRGSTRMPRSVLNALWMEGCVVGGGNRESMHMLFSWWRLSSDCHRKSGGG